MATATVRGTAFIIDCPTSDTCTFTVVEGTLEITPVADDPMLLRAGQTVTIAGDGVAGDVAEPGVSFDDDWLARNAVLDGLDGGDVAPDTGDENATAFVDAAPSGVWELTFTVEQSHIARGDIRHRPRTHGACGRRP